MPNARTEAPDARSLSRRRVYLGEGLRFDVVARGTRLQAEAIDLTCEGLGIVLTDAPIIPGVGELIGVGSQLAMVRHVGRLRGLPRLGLKLVPDT
jgi:hypothetical protein